MPDIAIPIVFPDYKISVTTPPSIIDIPDLIPGFDILPDKVGVPSVQAKVPELGHAGILFFQGATGVTKYYEYGRYAPGGTVRKLTIRNLEMLRDGHPTKVSLTYVLSQISIKAGKGGRIEGAYIQADGKYQAMLNYAQKRYQENINSKRKPYDIFSNSCNHFMQGVLEAAGISLPYMVDPRPNSYIDEIRENYPDLNYSRADNLLRIENPPQSLAQNIRAMIQPASA